ncbi:MAG: ribosome biogenesis/translation initiation ATPase RLI [Candidatus Thermoplasmatota archaeon]|nr:ribosome biogenesis/translation initiation ATPase RLI [Candidatus Thermoplasmatota archaeon]
MRIAVLERDRCYPKKCSQECMRYCPRVRSGDETIVMDEKTGKPIISEELCVGCGICVRKCPFNAIHIENLADELEVDLIHQFGENEFRLFRLPVPKKGKVVGILGQNGIGKTTAIKILSGELKPNLGKWQSQFSVDELEYWRGTEMYNYMKDVFSGSIEVAFKSQYVDQLALADSKVMDIVDSAGIIKKFELEGITDRRMNELSGGGLQKVAIASTTAKDADIYFFDEPSSYLDINCRIKMAKAIRSLAEDKMVIVVEHDLAVLDFLADIIYLIYGKKGVYGIVTQPKSVRHGINLYLSGYLKEENIRFGEEIKFEIHPPREKKSLNTLLTFNKLKKTFDNFKLETEEGEIHESEVVGVVGPNAIGKTTFVKMLAGVIEPTEGEIDSEVKVSYKPQYVRPVEGTVREIFMKSKSLNPFYEKEIIMPLGVENYYYKKLKDLSGGELQTVAISLCLSREADIYLIDEPSAYLDSTQRMNVAKVINRVMDKEGVAALVVDHDVYFIDMVSQSLMVFTGEAETKGRGMGPFDLRTGMNIFLKELEITFRRDEESNRPRVNKLDSRLDREQKATGEYYYEPVG